MSTAFQGNGFEGNGFQIGAPQSGGSSNKTLTADAGSYALTGTSAALLVVMSERA